MLRAYCNVIHPRNGTYDNCRGYWRVEGFGLRQLDLLARTHYEALVSTLTELMKRAGERKQPLRIFVSNRAVLSNQQVLALASLTGSTVEWLAKEQLDPLLFPGKAVPNAR